MKNSLLRFTILALTAFPALAFAASAPRDFKGLVTIFTDIISMLIVLVFALTFLVFMWGVVKGWIIHGGDAEGIQQGKNVVIVGIIALVVMSAIWGILKMLQAGLFGG